jgi:hypothetical protein
MSLVALRVLAMWPGVRRAGLPRLSPALTPGQRRRRRRLDSNTAQFCNAAQAQYRTVCAGYLDGPRLSRAYGRADGELARLQNWSTGGWPRLQSHPPALGLWASDRWLAVTGSDASRVTPLPWPGRRLIP